mmetsp:Transcript_17432/g.51577  ORF Transcript_17432/g.51577 Transcript_17432/m.51577 type:complete len:1083 (-) Transcript_17432:189-3437(-)
MTAVDCSTPVGSVDEVVIKMVVHAGRNLPLANPPVQCGVYVVITAGNVKKETTVSSNAINPVWNQTLLMRVPIEQAPVYAVIEVKDCDPVGVDTTLGTVFFPLCALPVRALRQWFPLGRTPGSKIEGEGEVYMEIGVQNPRPISESVRQQFEAFCMRKGYQLDMLVDAEVADSVQANSVSPLVGMSPDFPRLDSPESDEETLPLSTSGLESRHDVALPSQTVERIPPDISATSVTASVQATATEDQTPILGVVPSQPAVAAVSDAIEPQSSNSALGSMSHADVGEPAVAVGDGAQVSDDADSRSGHAFYNVSDDMGALPAEAAPAPPSPQIVLPEGSEVDRDDGEFVDFDQFVRTSLERPQERIHVPGALEEIEVYIPNSILSTQSQRAVADVVLTDFRLVLMCRVPHDEDMVADETAASLAADGATDDAGADEVELPRRSSARLQIGSDHDLSTYVPLGTVMEVTLRTSKSGRIARRAMGSSDQLDGSGAATAMEGSARFMQLVVRCRDFRTLTLTFTASGRDAGLEARIRSLHLRLLHLIDNTHTQPPALHLRCMSSSHWQWYNPVREFTRQGAVHDGVQEGKMSPWRQCNVNAGYEVCPTYPSVWYVPRCLDDDTMVRSAAFRSKGRLPVLCWYNKRVGNSLVRCAQPMVGATGRRSEADEFLLHAVRQTGPDSSMLMIFDARSSLAEKGNKLMGKGSEASGNYRQTKLIFMEIQNIHAVRQSADNLQALCEEGSEDKWLSKLEATGWLRHVRSVLSAGCALARKMANQKLSCLCHCSDGWDRTSQMTSLCQLFLDPYFRTITGFCVLIEKEWLSFGHMFTMRTYAPGSPVERSPIFLLFLDCVWQTIQQFPTAFEFGEELLILLADHFQSGWFGNFLCDCERDRNDFGISAITTSLWSHVDAIRDRICAPEYDPDGVSAGPCIPVCSMKRLTLWTGYFLRHEFAASSVTATSADEPSAQREHNTIVWVPDIDAKVCKDCGLKFTVTRRRHHCRACGNVFCNDCSKNRMALPSFGYDSEERVCDACHGRIKTEQDEAAAREAALVDEDTAHVRVGVEEERRGRRRILGPQRKKWGWKVN